LARHGGPAVRVSEGHKLGSAWFTRKSRYY
jgi:uncharacterized protein YodC (DUF2158 family)